MLCQKCKKNNATIHYRENINGKVTEYSLCADCAAELERDGVIKFENPFSNFMRDDIFDFASVLPSFFTSLNHALGSGETKRCPVCGSTFSDIARTGHIGCPQCYETFADELSATVNQLHGVSKPQGRIPKRFGEKQNREAEINSLKEEQKKAIEAQEFEKAAELRDKIKALEAEVNNANTDGNKSEDKKETK